VFYFVCLYSVKQNTSIKHFARFTFLGGGKKGQLFSQVLFQGMTGLKTSTKYLVKKKTGYYQN